MAGQKDFIIITAKYLILFSESINKEFLYDFLQFLNTKTINRDDMNYAFVCFMRSHYCAICLIAFMLLFTLSNRTTTGDIDPLSTATPFFRLRYLALPQK